MIYGLGKSGLSTYSFLKKSNVISLFDDQIISKKKIMIKDYFLKRDNMYCAFVLIDSNINPQKNDIDFIAHSFVRRKEDLIEIQNILDKKSSRIKLIAKIENKEGVDNIDEILEDKIEFKEQNSLTTAEEREQIAVIIRARDRNNNGMSRTEIVRMIMDITMAISTDVALNHYKYLMKKRLLPN